VVEGRVLANGVAVPVASTEIIRISVLVSDNAKQPSYKYIVERELSGVRIAVKQLISTVC